MPRRDWEGWEEQDGGVSQRLHSPFVIFELELKIDSYLCENSNASVHQQDQCISRISASAGSVHQQDQHILQINKRQ